MKANETAQEGGQVTSSNIQFHCKGALKTGHRRDAGEWEGKRMRLEVESVQVSEFIKFKIHRLG